MGEEVKMKPVKTAKVQEDTVQEQVNTLSQSRETDNQNQHPVCDNDY